METTKLRKFASWARIALIEQVGTRVKSVLAEQSQARRESASAVADLEAKIKELGNERVIEMVAYTWFNRFCALRFMDVNQYTTIGMVSPAEGFTQPEILTEAKQGVIDEELKVDRQRIIGLLDGTLPSHDAQGEVYQQLLIAVCNSYHKLMPFMFEKIADYTELLIPEDLLSDSSVLAETRKALTVENCADVEVIGWLYQFYISEKKDEVFAALKKGKKITPDNIPAATQLFTPHWIVRYLVENSLGRLWMLNHPDSKLIERMDYYIRPEEPETDFLKITSPEEIKVCDPACGSGHMLTYAFDLLYAIYEEQGYQATDVPRLILKHNLYGVEIDQRAGALSAFALVMKARHKDRRFFSRKSLDEDSSTAIQNPKSQIQNPNVCVLENISIDPEDLAAYMDKVGRDLFSGGLQGVVNQWEEADNFGSLIRPLVTDVRYEMELLRQRKMDEDLFLAGVHQQVLKALRQADYLSPKYHVVVANPPYLSRGMNSSLKAHLKQSFDDVRSDVFSAFVVRNCDLIIDKGLAGFMTPFTWMFLGTFNPLRLWLLENTTIMSLIRPEYHAFFESAYVPLCAFSIKKQSCPEVRGTFIDLSDFYGPDLQAPKTLEAIQNVGCKWRHSATSTDFMQIPGNLIAYWISDETLSAFSKNGLLGKDLVSREGLTTGDNGRFLRLWHEVSRKDIEFAAVSTSLAKESGCRWFPHQKGGEYRRWAGNTEFVLDWKDDGRAVKEFVDPVTGRIRSHNYNGEWAFQRGLTWSRVTISNFCVRHVEGGFTFDTTGTMAFAKMANRLPFIESYLNSCVAAHFMKVLAPTMTFQPGDALNLPFVATTDADVETNACDCIRLVQSDWNSFENSWAFTSPPLLEAQAGDPRIESTYIRLRARNVDATANLKKREEKNNQYFIDLFGVANELCPDIGLEHVTMKCNPHYRYGDDKDVSELEALLLADTMREFISYAVGCIFGRYSLEKPGLILANQGDTLADYLLRVSSRTESLEVKRALSNPESVGFVADAHVNCFSCGASVPVSDGRFVISGEYDYNNQLRGRPLIYCAECCDGKQSRYVTWQQPLEKFTVSQALQRKWFEPETLKSFLDLAKGFGHRLPVATSEVTFLPDEDNVIPLLDGNWFEDDITERFKTFLKVTFGTEHYDENLTFLENALYPDNLTSKKRKTIRDYFLKDFYSHHIKLYKKRPIYWLFSSPKGTFNALIYMHRYRPDTVGTVLHYVRDFRDKLAHHADHQQMLADSASASKTEKTQAIKDVAAIKKQLKELEDYEKTLFEVAARKIQIDLDDGVKRNYLLFGSVLRKIPGLDAKEDE